MPITELPAPGLGAAITPEQWATYVLEHLSAASVVLASGATRITTAQKVVHVPKVTSDGTRVVVRRAGGDRRGRSRWR